MLFFRRKAKVEDRLSAYFERCDECVSRFEKALEIYFSQGHGDAFAQSVGACHQAESQADDIRREIEHTLYGKALLPDSRGDLLGIIESFDRMPNVCSGILFGMLCQRTLVPEDLTDSIQQLASLNVEAYRLTRHCVASLFSNPKQTLGDAKAVDAKESESDRLERALIQRIFATEGGDTGKKILMRDLVLQIGDISDRAEDSADRIGIVAIKRQI